MEKRVLSAFLAIVMVVALLPASVFAVTAHTHNDGESFTAWTAASGNLTTGNYYLTESNATALTSNITIPANNTVTLCLNGNTLSMSNQKWILNRGTLIICDCKSGGQLTANTNCINNLGTLTVTGGTIVNDGTGVGKYGIFNNKGTLYFNGGTVQGPYGIYTTGVCYVSGGNVIGTVNRGIQNTGTCDISGGKIECQKGYGVYNSSNGILTVSEGVIEGKKGIYNQGKCTVSGGTVKGTGGDTLSQGIDTVGALFIAGNPTVTGQTGAIHLNNGGKIYATADENGNGGRYTGAPLSIYLDKPSDWLDKVLVYNATVGQFSITDTKYSLIKGSGDNANHLLLTDKPQHAHDDGTVLDTVWTTTGGNVDEGTYYLDSDITATDSIWFRGNVTLCLNGHTLDMGINVLEMVEGTLTICDCQAERGSVRGNSTNLIYIDGKSNLFLQNVNVVNTSTSYNHAIHSVDGTTVKIKDSYIEGHKGIINFGDLDIVNSEIKGADTGVTNLGTANIRKCNITGGNYGLMLEGGKTLISGECDISGRYAIWNYDGELEITGGYIHGTEYGVYLTGGNGIISGGTVEGTYYAVSNSEGSSVEICGSAILKNAIMGLSNSGTAIVSGGTIEGISVAIRNYSATGMLYICGSPNISATAANGYAIYTYSGIYAASPDGASVYEGDRLLITVESMQNGQVLVYGVTDENAGKFILANDRLQYTVYRSGDDLLLHAHEWAEDLSNDVNAHWYACTAENCTFTHEAEMKYYQFHTYVPDDHDCTTKYYCTECDYVKLPANTHDHAYSVDGNVITETCQNEGCDHLGKATVFVPDNLVYNGENHEILVEYDDFRGPYLEDEAKYYLNGVLTDSTVNAGKYDVVIELDGVKYELSYTVEKAPLTISANDNSIVYGDAPAGSGVSYDGFVGSDNQSVLDGTLEYVFDYERFAGVGTDYSITPKGLTSDNYDITFIPGKLTVTQLEAEIQWSTLSEDDLVYDGSAKTLTALLQNKQNDDAVSLTVVLSGDNVNVTEDGFYYTVTGLEGAGAGNYKLSSEVKSAVYMIAQADYPVVWPQNLVGNHGEPLSTVQLSEGFTWDKPDEVIQYGNGHEYAATYTPKDTVNYKVAHGFITVNGADVTAPTGTVAIGENSWNTLWNDITFGLFFKETQTVTVTAEDAESGITKTEYYLATEKTDDFTNVQWTAFEGSFDIDPNNKYVVYIRITNGAGYRTVINSDGVVLDSIAPVISGIENGKAVYGDATFTVDEDNLASVTVDGKTVDAVDGKYTIPADNAEHTLAVADQSGNRTEYKLTVYKNYTVTFVVDGKEIAKQVVGHGKDAELPEIPAKDGYTAKWNVDGKNITADITITAEYTEDVKTDIPPTGDSGHLALWFALLLISGVGLAEITVLGKKRSN